MITTRVLLFSFPVENPRSSKRTVKTVIRSTSQELTLDKRKISACHSSSLSDAPTILWLSAFRPSSTDTALPHPLLPKHGYKHSAVAISSLQRLSIKSTPHHLLPSLQPPFRELQHSAAMSCIGQRTALQLWTSSANVTHLTNSVPLTGLTSFYPEGCHGNLGGLWESGERQIGCEE